MCKPRQTRLPACPGQVKITGGQENVKLTFPFGQVINFNNKTIQNQDHRISRVS